MVLLLNDTMCYRISLETGSIIFNIYSCLKTPGSTVPVAGLCLRLLSWHRTIASDDA
jgi:hypothetical protein